VLQDKLSNIWYFSSKILPLYTADRTGDSTGVPRLDNGVVVIPGGGMRRKL
jgi:hypothetical protein